VCESLSRVALSVRRLSSKAEGYLADNSQAPETDVGAVMASAINDFDRFLVRAADAHETIKDKIDGIVPPDERCLTCPLIGIVEGEFRSQPTLPSSPPALPGA